MDEKRPTYIPGVGWRYEIEHSMLRRMHDHDYRGRSIYMVTLTTEGRQPVLGHLRYKPGKAEEAWVEATELGRRVVGCWQQIPCHYPEVRLLAFQLMPDHIHGLLFVTRGQEAHLGQMINGFKVGCNRAYRRVGRGLEGVKSPERVKSPEAVPQETQPTQETGPRRDKHPEHGLLFEPGYQDSVLKGKDQLERMFRYIADNPRRLAMKRERPELFRVVREVKVRSLEAMPQETQPAMPQETGRAQETELPGLTFAGIGNHWLLERPVRLQVRCHNNTTPENLRMIERQKAYCLERGKKEGAVVVSPCISPGEKEIARAALEAGIPLVVILENGFPPMYKPPGRYFEACCRGLLLMLAPWPYHMERRTIKRWQCLALNEMARRLSTEGAEENPEGVRNPEAVPQETHPAVP